MEHAKSFRDLIVHQKARGIARRVFVLSHTFPKEERFALTDQIRRASRSIGAQIAEAWAKRKYVKHFASKLSDADGEQMETQHWIDTALDCEYLSQQVRDELIDELERIGRMLQSMMDKADQFCAPSPWCVREEASESCFFTDH